MTDSRGANDMSNKSDYGESYNGYLNRAVDASEAGDHVLAMHLYLAAYEKAVTDPDIPDGMAISGLREAWNLACELKERSMAEYVFEKLEPFLTGEEIAVCANKLQDLALDRLEEYGFSREELQDMANLISQDLIDGEGSILKVESITIPPAALAQGGGTVAIGAASGISALAPSLDDPDEDNEEGLFDSFSEGFASQGETIADWAPPVQKKRGKPEQTGVKAAPADFNPYDFYDTSSVGKSYHAATNDGTGSYIFTRDVDRARQSEEARAQAQKNAQANGAAQVEQPEQAAAMHGEGEGGTPESPAGAQPPASTQTPANAQPPASPIPIPGVIAALTGKGEGASGAPADAQPAEKPEGSGALSASQKEAMPAMPDLAQNPYPLNYRQLVGYDDATSLMRDFGIGLQRDKGFRNFVSMMNFRHGLDRMPTIDTLLFRAPVIEDATRFVDATIGEIGLPVLRMTMEEGFQGAPLLCVTTMGDSRPRMNHARNRFDGPAILVLDDLDTWTMPQMQEGVEGIAGFVMANISRGAREAMNLIRSAVEDPDVYVLATAALDGEVDPFFYEVLEPITIVDIGLPNDSERSDIWADLSREHPSMRKLDRDLLVRYSAGLSRYDLYMVARAAVEDAYKMGLMQRMYLPVSPQNILEKLAGYQPLDSDEYHAIEEEILRQFRDELDDLENLVDPSSE